MTTAVHAKEAAPRWERLSALERAYLALANPVIFWAVGFLVLILRRPGVLTDAQFIYEDGREWYVDAKVDPLGTMLRPYAGYLLLLPRSIALLEVAAPASFAPLIGAVISLAIVAAVAVYATKAVPGWTGIGVGFALILLPNTTMSLGSPTFLHFYLGVALVIGVVVPRVGWAGRIGLAIAAISGPHGILLGPLYGVRWLLRRDRDSVWRMVAVGVPASVVLAVILIASRISPQPVLSAWDIASIAATHLTVMLTGTVVASPFLAVPQGVVAVVIAGILGLALAAVWSLPRWLTLGAGYICAATIAAALLFGTDERELLLSPMSAARYFLVPGFVVSALIVLAAARQNRAGIALLALLTVGWAGDFLMTNRPPSQWAEASACLATAGPCVAPVYPGGQWDIVWP